MPNIKMCIIIFDVNIDNLNNIKLMSVPNNDLINKKRIASINSEKEFMALAGKTVLNDVIEFKNCYDIKHSSFRLDPIRGKLLLPIFPNVHTVFFGIGCDHNMVHYWLDQIMLPNIQNI